MASKQMDILGKWGEPTTRQGNLAFRIYKGMRKCYHRILPKSYQRQFTRADIRFFLNRADHTSKKVILEGASEREQVNYIFTVAKEKKCDVFLDIGANFGYYSLIAAKMGIFTEIHAFEPHPETYHLLIDHIERNAFNDMIMPHHFAASDKDAKMFIDKKSWGKATVSENKRQATIAIKATTLDSVFDFVGKRIAIKIDVEGHEISALAGMQALFTGNAVFLQVEIWGWSIDSFYYLIGIGFRCIYRINDDFYFVNDKWSEIHE